MSPSHFTELEFLSRTVLTNFNHHSSRCKCDSLIYLWFFPLWIQDSSWSSWDIHKCPLTFLRKQLVTETWPKKGANIILQVQPGLETSVLQYPYCEHQLKQSREKFYPWILPIYRLFCCLCLTSSSWLPHFFTLGITLKFCLLNCRFEYSLGIYDLSLHSYHSSQNWCHWFQHWRRHL